MQTKSLNKLVLNLKTPKITQESLDNEVREMFKNREEGLNFINSQDWESEQSKQNAMKSLDRVYPDIVEYSALSQLKRKVGDILTTKSGRKYRIDEPADKEGLRTWGKDHILLRELNDKGEDVFDFGSYGWFPIGDFLKK